MPERWNQGAANSAIGGDEWLAAGDSFAQVKPETEPISGSMHVSSENPVLISRVHLRNYKSVANCSVTLGPLTILVGPNGAGKSNFLDALRLVTESLNASLDHALRERGGIAEVRRRSAGHPTHFAIRLEFRLPDGATGWYAFRVGARQGGGFEVQEEECKISSIAAGDGGTEGFFPLYFYRVESGRVTKCSEQIFPPASDDRLYLVSAAGLPVFRPLYDALSHMGFYNLNPEVIRELQPPDPGEVLRRDGGNLASVLSVLEHKNPGAKDRIAEFLAEVVPDLTGIEARHMGKMETIEFRQKVGNNVSAWRFPAESMSDGTLRALGVLTALFQLAGPTGSPVRLVGIEEPEAAVHPGAAGILRDALRQASLLTQVLVTSHSPDLLDDKDVRDDWILAVRSENGETKIGPVNEVGRSAIRDRLFTAGELLRQGQLLPEPSPVPPQLSLFGDESA